MNDRPYTIWVIPDVFVEVCVLMLVIVLNGHGQGQTIPRGLCKNVPSRYVCNVKWGQDT